MLAKLGERIVELREEAGMTQADFRKAARVSQGYVYRMESGQQNMSVRSLSRVAVALGTTMARILEGIDADPSTIGTRAFAWREGSDPRPKAPKKKV